MKVEWQALVDSYVDPRATVSTGNLCPLSNDGSLTIWIMLILQTYGCICFQIFEQACMFSNSLKINTSGATFGGGALRALQGRGIPQIIGKHTLFYLGEGPSICS
jgi:hypothetical protein